MYDTEFAGQDKWKYIALADSFGFHLRHKWKLQKVLPGSFWCVFQRRSDDRQVSGIAKFLPDRPRPWKYPCPSASHLKIVGTNNIVGRCRGPPLPGVATLALGGDFSAALTVDDSTSSWWFWGKNEEGQLGFDDRMNRLLPTRSHALPPDFRDLVEQGVWEQ